MISGLKILAKQTTGQGLKCKECEKILFGEEGYLQFTFHLKGERWRDHRFCICAGCITELMKKINKNTYEKLVKKVVIKKLK